MRQRVRLSAAIGVVSLIALLTLIGVDRQLRRQPQVPGRDAQCGKCSAQETKQDGLDLVEVRDSDPDLEQAAPCARWAANLPHGYETIAERRARRLRMRFGLFQSGLAASGNEAYREGLRRIMLPRLLLRLEKVLQANRPEPRTCTNR